MKLEYEDEDTKDKVPLDKVLDDMDNPDGGMISMCARDYYYRHYATDEEKKVMDREDRIWNYVKLIYVAVASVLVIWYMIQEVISLFK